MNLFEVILKDDLFALSCLVAIAYIVGTNMADAVVRRWGWRAAAGAYVVFVICACETIRPTRASELAHIVFRALFAGGLAVGAAWITLAVVLFFVGEMKSVEQMLTPLPETPQKESEREEYTRDGGVNVDDAPTEWKPKVRDFSKLPAEDLQEFQEHRNRVSRWEMEARVLLQKLRTPATLSAPPPSLAERRRLQTQLDELQLAREFFADSGGDLQQVGRALVECDGRIKSIESALGRIPPDTSSELPQLAGIAVFDEAIARRPKNAALYVERAKYLIGKRHYERSIADCNQALQLLPNYYAAFNIRGFAHHHLGKCSAAVRNFERAIYEDPSYAWAYASLAATYNAAGAYREALGPAYYASITIAAGHNQLAIAYEHLSEHEKAVHHLTRVIEADPDAKRVPNARVRRAQQLIKLGRNQLAMHDLRTHLARKSDAAASQLLAQLKSLSACNGNATDAEGVDEDPHAEVVEQQLGIVEG